MIAFFVPGIPRPQGSKRLVGWKSGRPHMIESSRGLADWRRDVTLYAMAAKGANRAEVERIFAEPIALAATFVVPRPESHLRKDGLLRPGAKRSPTGKPDLSKYLRAIEDAITGVLWRDDAQVVRATVSKRYGAEPGAHIEVSEENP